MYNCDYKITVDFPNQKVNGKKLSYQIRDSSIVTVLSHINTDIETDDCDIWFNSEPSEPEKTTLDGLVAAHDGECCPPCCCRFVNDVELAGDEPTDEDVSAWDDCDTAIGLGQSGKRYLMHKENGAVVSVEITA